MKAGKSQRTGIDESTGSTAARLQTLIGGRPVNGPENEVLTNRYEVFQCLKRNGLKLEKSAFYQIWNGDSGKQTVDPTLITSIELAFPQLKGMFAIAPIYRLKSALGHPPIELVLDPDCNEMPFLTEELLRAALEAMLEERGPSGELVGSDRFRIKLETLKLPLLRRPDPLKADDVAGPAQSKVLQSNEHAPILFGEQIGWWGLSNLQIDVSVKVDHKPVHCDTVRVVSPASVNDLSRRSVAVVFSDEQAPTDDCRVQAELSVYPRSVCSVSVGASQAGPRLSIFRNQTPPLPTAIFWLDEGAILAVSDLPQGGVVEIDVQAVWPLGFELLPDALKGADGNPMPRQQEERILQIARLAAQDAEEKVRRRMQHDMRIQRSTVAQLRYVRKNVES